MCARLLLLNVLSGSPLLLLLLSSVMAYLGSGIAFYFLFVGFYTRSLLWPATGALVPVHGCPTRAQEPPISPSTVGVAVTVLWILQGFPSTDDQTDPDADDSLPWFFYLRVFNALFIMLWSTWCLEHFQQKVALHAYIWDVEDGVMEEKPVIRAPFIAEMQTRVATSKNTAKTQVMVLDEMMRDNDAPMDRASVESRYETLRRDLGQFNDLYYLPVSEQRWLIFKNSVVVFFLCCVVVTITIGVVILPDRLFGESTWAEVAAGVVNGVFLPILHEGYRLLALYLTDLELHRYDKDHENSLVLKLFVFQFVSSYSGVLYIGATLDLDRLRNHLLGIMITGRELWSSEVALCKRAHMFSPRGRVERVAARACCGAGPL